MNNISIPVSSTAPALVSTVEVTGLNGTDVPAQQVQLVSIVHLDANAKAWRAQWVRKGVDESVVDFISRAVKAGCKSLRVYYAESGGLGEPGAVPQIRITMSNTTPLAIAFKLVDLGGGFSMGGPEWKFIDAALDPEITEINVVDSSADLHLAAY